jgi:hypothetical protein
VSLEAHYLAELFPLMEGKPFADLVADIRDNGLREPIVTFEGKILDGRNRYRACMEIGIEPLTRDWDQKGDILAFVLSKNLNRRHLNTSQRAMVAAKIANLALGSNQHVHRVKHDNMTGGVFDPPFGSACAVRHRLPNAAAASQSLNVGKRSTKRANQIIQNGVRELQDAVEAGRITVWNADAIARQPEDKQREIVMRDSKAVAAAAKALRDERPTKKPPLEASHDAKRAKAQVWANLKSALDLIRGMPLASDVAKIARSHDKSDFVDVRLARALRWLEEFSNAWNVSSSQVAQIAESRDDGAGETHHNSGNGSVAA